MWNFWGTVKTLFSAHVVPSSKHHSPSKYHGRTAAETTHTLKGTGGDLASGITTEKQKAFWQGVNVGKKMR